MLIKRNVVLMKSKLVYFMLLFVFLYGVVGIIIFVIFLWFIVISVIVLIGFNYVIFVVVICVLVLFCIVLGYVSMWVGYNDLFICIVEGCLFVFS